MLQQSAEAYLPSGQGAVPTGLTVGEPVGQRVAKMKARVARSSRQDDAPLPWPVDDHGVHAFGGQEEIRHLCQGIAVRQLKQRSQQNTALERHRAKRFSEGLQRLT